MNDDHLRYPIGKFTDEEVYTPQSLSDHIGRIERLPANVVAVIRNFSARDFDTPYREGGWSARQLLHHLADSHMNAYIRVKWTLTEDTPVIKAYNEKRWAETAEVKLDPMLSVSLLKALHPKWTALLKTLNANDLQKQYIHPETRKHFRLDRLVAMYAWHGEHHLAHLKIIAKQPI